MKRGLITAVLVFCLTGFAYAGAFDAQDEEAQMVADFCEDIMGESGNWGARLQEASDDGIVYLVYHETVVDGEALYWYYEIKLSAVNANARLLKKYNLD